MRNKQENKRLFLVSLATATVAISSVSPLVAEASFSDFGLEHSGYKAVEELMKQNIFTGYGDGTFRPYEHISRQHVAVVLSRAKDYIPPFNVAEALSNYNDVNKNHLYAWQIAAVTNAGVFKGSNGSFNPNTNITREQTATVLVEAFNLKDQNTSIDLIDINHVGNSHRKNVIILAQHGITIGKVNKEGERYFDPKVPVTRSQFGNLLYSAIQVSKGETLTKAPIAKNVIIRGTEVVGNTLASTYEFYDPNGNEEGKTLFQWYRSDFASGNKKVAIEQATSSSYQLTPKDEGKYITLEVVPVAKVANPIQGDPAMGSSTGAIVAAKGSAPKAQKVMMKGSENVGETLSVTYEYTDADNDAEGKSIYQWYRADDASGKNIELIKDAKSTSYVLTTADEGKYISFKMTPVATTGTPSVGAEIIVKSTGSITAAQGKAPIATNLVVNGPEVVGGMLKATYSYNDADGDLEGSSKYQWYRSDNIVGENKVALVNANSTSYKLTPQDEGKYITFAVIPIAKTGTPNKGAEVTAGTTNLISAAKGAIPEASNVNISGGPYEVGATLIGKYSYKDADGDLESGTTFKWYRSESATGAKDEITGAISNEYKLTAGDEAKFIWFEVTPRAASGAERLGTPELAVTNNKINAKEGSAPEARSISMHGTLKVGSKLEGRYDYHDADNDTEGESVYQWYRGNDKIELATAKTYTLTSADQGEIISFEVTPKAKTGIPNVGSSVKISSSTTIVAATGSAPEARNVAIDKSEEPIVGEKLTASYNYFDAEDDKEADSVYQWYRGDQLITDANSLSYTLTKEDESKTITFKVTPKSKTGDNKVGETIEKRTGTVKAASGSAPVANNASINGGLQVGATLTGKYSFTDADGDEEGSSIYQWYRNDVLITDANNQTYTLTNDDAGKIISFKVTPVAATGTPKTGVEVVVKSSVVIEAASGSAPVAEITSINGGLQVGATLTGIYSYSDANDDQEGTSIYSWYRADNTSGLNKTPIVNANEKSYTLTNSEEGKYIIFEVTPVAKTGAPNKGVAVSGYTSGTIVATTGSAPIAKDVSIQGAGNATVGDNLEGKYTYLDADGDTESGTTFQWYRAGVAIEGATEQNYTLTNLDEGKVIVFKVTPKSATGDVKDGKTIEAYTSIIKAANGTAPTASQVFISGALAVGQTVTGNYMYSDAENDLEGKSVYQWYRDNTPIQGATGKTYKVSSTDVNSLISFEVTPVAQTGLPNTGSPTKVAASGNVKSVGLTLSNPVISEAPTNDGSITETQVVTLTEGKFVTDLTNAITFTNLPLGLVPRVTRVNDTQLKIAFTGQAGQHTANDNVSNVSITVGREYIVNSSEDVTSSHFAIKFSDPDTTAPEITTANITAGTNAGELDLLIGLNEPGKVYYVVQSAGEITPTAAQVQAGKDSADQTAVAAGTVEITDAAINQSKTVTGLTPGASYVVYFVAEDTLNNVSGVKASANVTSTDQVNKASLNTTISAAEDKVTIATAGAADGNYPQAAIDTLSQAVTVAKVVASNIDATEAEVSQAVVDLNQAISQFENTKVTVLKTTLDTVIVLAKTLSDTPYTTSTWSALQTAITSAEATNASTIATQVEVDDELTALKTAIESLEYKPSEIVRTIDLLLAISDAQGTVANVTAGAADGNYPQVAIDTLNSAIDTAKDVFTNATTQAEVNAAISDLNDAVSTFQASKVVVNITGLDTAIALVTVSLVESNYTSASWSVLQTALASANDVKNDPNATQAKVTTAHENLNSAISDLEKTVQNAPNTVELLLAISAAQATANSATTGGADGNYPQIAIDKLNIAIANAKDTFTTATTQVEVDAEIITLDDAVATFKTFKVVVNKTGLGTAATLVTIALEEANYTPVSWAGLKTALIAANGVKNDLAATQAEVTTAHENLNTAIGDLVKTDLTTPNTLDLLLAISEAQWKATDATPGAADGNYPQAAITALNTAINAAKDVFNNNTATQTNVDAAKTVLDDAIAAFDNTKVVVNQSTEDVANAVLGLASVDTAVSSVETVATVNKTAAGVTITAVAAGTTTVTVKDANGNEASIAVTVTETGGVLDIGTVVTAYVPPAAPVTEDVTNAALGLTAVDTIVSSSETIATAAKTAAGVTITAVAAGTTTVTVKDTNGNEASIAVTVTETGGVLDIDTAVTAYAPPAAPVTEDVTNAALGLTAVNTIVSSSETIATAAKTAAGVTITAVAAGTTTVTVKDANGNEASIAVTVTETDGVLDIDTVVTKYEPITYTISGAAGANEIEITFSEAIGTDGTINPETGGTVADAAAVISSNGLVLITSSVNGALDGETVILELTVNGMIVEVTLTYTATGWTLVTNPVDFFEEV